MNQPRWRDPDFLDEMADVADAPADALVAELFRTGEAWTFVRSMSQLDHLSGHSGAPPAVLRFFEEHIGLPSWADQAEIDRTEELFDGHSITAVTALFCASLPECYVLGDEAAVLHRTGQLEDKTLYRVRQTGRFIFSVMAEGGLDDPSVDHGADWVSGRLQILVVRLIHAIVRHLIENPAEAGVIPGAGAQDSVASVAPWADAFSRAEGKIGIRPISQLQLAYTLLTFSYVIMRSLRKWGIRWSPVQERAYMHTWNTAGHILGVDARLMAWSYDEGDELFGLIKERFSETTDEGKALTESLTRAMQVTFRWRILGTIPSTTMRLLLGPETSRRLGVPDRHPGVLPHLFSRLFLGALRVLGAVSDTLGRSIPFVRRLFERVARGFVDDLMRTETRTYFAPMRLANPPVARRGLLHRIMYRSRPTPDASG